MILIIRRNVSDLETLMGFLYFCLYWRREQTILKLLKMRPQQNNCGL